MATSLDHLFEMLSDLVVVTTRTGEIVMVNQAWERTLGWSRQELVGSSVFDLVHPEDREGTEASGAVDAPVSGFTNRYRHRDGTWRSLLWSARSDGEHWYAVAKDVTEQRSLERRALYDDLTQLGNRGLLIDHLAGALRRLGDGQRRLLALLFVDLDGFKAVNDSLGHEAGDQLLVEVACRLREVVRSTDLITRFGGDEFVIVTEGMSREATALGLGQRIVTAISREYELGDGRYTLSCSIGIAVTRDPGEAAETLLREGDTAMYRAKTQGTGRVELYDAAVKRQAAAQAQIEQGLRTALQDDALKLEYQPVVSVPERTLAGCEALVRWNHPERGTLLPAEFIPAAEASSLIVQVGARVLELACQQAGTWRRRGQDLTVSVNVSRRQLLEPDFLGTVQEALERGGVPGQMLCIEVTETATARHSRIAEVLRQVRSLGIKIALDDFGAGYSTLANLRELPIDVIKIDRSFIRGIASGGDDREIVAAVVALARELGISVVAEGVETEEQYAALEQMGCDLAQGFLFAAAGPADQLGAGGFNQRTPPGMGDAFVIREFMRQIGIPARIAR